MDADIADYFATYYPSEWATLEDQLIGGYLSTDITGASDMYNFNYGYVFETSGGEIVVDSDGYLSPLDAAGESGFVDGYYRLYAGYGFTL